MSDPLDTLLDMLAERVADKIKGLIADASGSAIPDEPKPKKGKGSPPKNTVPKNVVDDPEEEVEEEAEEGGDSDEEEEDSDSVTEDQISFVRENVELPDEDGMRSELQEMYESLGEDAAEVQNALLDLEGDELEESYVDYVARLCEHDHEGNITGIVTDVEAAYRTVRVIDEEEVLVWAKGTVPMTDEEVEEEGLGDPAEPPKKKALAKKIAPKKSAPAEEPKKRSVTRKPRGK